MCVPGSDVYTVRTRVSLTTYTYMYTRVVKRLTTEIKLGTVQRLIDPLQLALHVYCVVTSRQDSFLYFLSIVLHARNARNCRFLVVFTRTPLFPAAWRVGGGGKGHSPENVDAEIRLRSFIAYKNTAPPLSLSALPLHGLHAQISSLLRWPVSIRKVKKYVFLSAR